MSSTYAHLLPPSWKACVQAWLDEDCPSFDWGGYVLIQGVLAGVPFVNAVFEQLACSVKWHYDEGHYVRASESVPGTPPGRVKVAVAHVSGPVRQLLLGERVALNTLARCSGIATASREMLEAVRAAGFQGTVAGTRKTTPGFRLVEKYGMIVGGVDAHRYDLSSMVMLKDNHVWSTGSIRAAVAQARRVAGFSIRIDVEVQSEAEAEEAICAGADVVMLDNMVGDELVTCAHSLKARLSGTHRFLLESSGGITLANLQMGQRINDGM